MGYRDNDKPAPEAPPNLLAARADLFDESTRRLSMAWHAAIEVALGEALIAANGDAARVVRESHADNVQVIKLDEKPFRRVEIVMPDPFALDLVIEVKTTDLTKEQP